MPVTVLPAAEKFMRRIVRFSDHPDGGFRLRVTSGGCSGYSSKFSVEAKPLEDDIELTVNGLRIFMPSDTRGLLEGVTVDYAETPVYSGLSFFSPNSSACVCSSASHEGKPPPHASISLTSIKRL